MIRMLDCLNVFPGWGCIVPEQIIQGNSECNEEDQEDDKKFADILGLILLNI